MRLRSWLFVPADRPERFNKALASGADALIFDLEDSVSAIRKAFARDAMAEALRDQGSARLFVRINPADSPHFGADLAAVAAAAPFGLMLPKTESGAGVARIADRLTALGNTTSRLIAIATETPMALFGLGTYREAGPRLAALTWGAEDLSAAIGAATPREADGRWTPPYEVARSLALFAAHAAGIGAIDTVFPHFGDDKGLAAFAARGRRDGFGGMLAIHPVQVPIINEAFTPKTEEIAWATRVVELFRDNPGQGALALDGHMVDAPHLKLARRLLGVDDDQAALDA